MKPEMGVVFERRTGRSYSAGFSVSVMSLLPFSLAGRRSESQTHRYEIEKVEERMFVPSENYVRQSMLQAEVLHYLAKYRYRKSIYMVVGTKVAIGGKISYTTEYDGDANLAATLPGVAVGIPAEVGGKISAGMLNHRNEQKEITGAFVFAYRLREIRIHKRRGSS